MRILVIEDERALCETIVRSLKRLAYSVDFCYDGNKANELLGIEKYDLVLLDLNLPGADGMTVLRTLRQTDRDTGVLILSARCEVADKVEGLDAGANDYLTKPFHLEELEARIRSLTRRRFTQNNVVLNSVERLLLTPKPVLPLLTVRSCHLPEKKSEYLNIYFLIKVAPSVRKNCLTMFGITVLTISAIQ